jgi:FMN phosphatase YigB (HAD superfamily)
MKMNMEHNDWTRGGSSPDEIIFLLDVDNTLLDNDFFEATLKQFLTQEFGAGNCDRYWVLLNKMQARLGYPDYLGALQHYQWDLNDPRLLLISSFLLDHLYEERLYPGVLDALKHLRVWGLTVILSDGDLVLQPRKIRRSGLWGAVENRVLIYVHKERMLEAVIKRYPAKHYVMVDDNLGILTGMKAVLSDRVTTVQPLQGRYATDPKNIGAFPPADITIKGMGELVNYDLPAFLGRAAARAL